jgi:hypothetical protein
MRSLLVAAALLASIAHAAPDAAPQSASFGSLGLPDALSKPRLQSLLQTFVDSGYGRCFRHLGDERDFDHGHVLIDARTRAPIAILYHTQELAAEASAADYGYVDPDGRNWLQWLDGRGIENARSYERASYPRSGSWDWFVARELPKLRERHTITDKMLDPTRLGSELAQSLQWTFTRTACPGAGPDDASRVMRVTLPDRTPVCLALSAQ